MSIGNTFGATSLSSFGGFWISIAIILTPGGFNIEESYTSLEFQHAFALFLFVSLFNVSAFSILIVTLPRAGSSSLPSS
jgi:succinate-acetate transporter protein